MSAYKENSLALDNRSIRDGTFPVDVIRVGRVIRVPTNALRRLLQLDGAGLDGHTLPVK